MELIENNPFRILGLPLTATVREIDKRANDLETFASMGKTKTFDTDFFNFVPVVRTLEKVTEAKKKLQLDEEKFRHSLFWFWINNSVDELAIDLLRDGDMEKAKTIWEKAVFANSEDVYAPVVVIEDLVPEFANTDNDNWHNENERDYLSVEKLKEGAGFLTVFADFEDTEKWLIECDCEWMDGATDSPFGIVFGREGKDFFTFNISANGSYSLFRYVDWKLGKIVDWTDSDAIDGYGINHLEIQRNRDEIILRINGEEVDRIEREPFFGQYFGFYVHNIQTLHFSNLRLSKIEKDPRYGSGILVSNKNVSCVKNLSLLQLYHSNPHGILKSYSWEPSISLFERFVSSEYFDEYANSVAGEKFVLNRSDIIDYYSKVLIGYLKSSLDKTYGVTTSEFINSFSIFPGKNYQAVKNLFVAGTIQKIDKAIAIAEQQRLASAIKAVESGNKLISSIESEIEQLSSTLGTGSIEYQLATDNVVTELVRSAIDHSNEIFEPELELPLLKFASKIAVTPKSVEFANRNLRGCERAVPEKQVLKLLEKTQTLIAATPGGAVSVGQKLITECKEPLTTLEEVAGADSEEYKRCSDAVSNLLVQCGIVHFNATKNDEPALPLYRYAVALAESSEAEKYADENLASCKEWIEKKHYMLCYFCGKNLPEKEASITKTMYVETTRDRHFNSTRVGYSYGDVLVPRCGVCKSLHQESTSYYLKLSVSILSGAAAGFVGGVLIYPHFKNFILRMGSAFPVGGWAFSFASLFLIGLICGLIARRLLPTIDTSDVRKASDINGFPEIKKRLSEGWTFNQPSA
ncbi:MAG TPA: hypothetical protein PLK77_03950 [Pyrinomonadaceae bacterium]|nr:hypothetical protein [Pyrinomonadaceae bacterium]